MPTIRDVQPFLTEMAQAISKIGGVKSVLLWGSTAKNLDNPTFVLRDIDLIAVTQFYSEDLLSIIDGKNSPFKLAFSVLEDEGFDPLSVAFTKQFVSLNEYNIDHWAISSDKKLLHWGATLENKEEWDDLRREAEEYATFITKSDRRKLARASQDAKDRWSLMYDHHINKFLSKMPRGWFQSEHPLSEILGDTVKLT